MIGVLHRSSWEDPNPAERTAGRSQSHDHFNTFAIAHEEDGGGRDRLHAADDNGTPPTTNSLTGARYRLGTMEPRDLPSVDKLVRELVRTAPAGKSLPHAVIVEIARGTIEHSRRQLAEGGEPDPTASARAAVEAVERLRPAWAVNATGVLLHTNLGRAPLDPAAAEAASRAATGYSNLEMNLADGSRGGRGHYVHHLLKLLTGAEAAMVVNNNAGALYLALVALAGSGSVPVSRGELIEIGGSYRLPDLMAATGAQLREVGTTNRTRISDYEAAIDGTTSLMLKVHPSNYRVTGFTDEADVADLARLAHSHRIPLVFDAGSGLLDERTPWISGPPPEWLVGEPGVRQSLDQGADLVMFSGDKLLGGPQAGIIVGDGSIIDRLKKHPVARAFRIDGPSLTALSVTLERYADGTAAGLPFWQMATATYEDLERRCRAIADGLPVTIVRATSTVGAGSVPGATVPSPAIAIEEGTDRNYRRLLAGSPPIVGHREGGRLLLDLRTVPAELDPLLRERLEDLWR